MDGRLLQETLLGEIATLESDDKAIVAVCAKNITVPDVRVAKPETYRFLTVISKEPAHFSQTMYGTRAEAEPPSAILTSDVNVKFVKAVITIEPGPHQAHLAACVIDLNLRAIPHG